MKWITPLFFTSAFIGVMIWQSYRPSANSLYSENMTENEQQVEINMPVDIDGYMPPTIDKLDNKDVWQTENLRALLDFYIAYYEEGEQRMWQEFNQYCRTLDYCAGLMELFKRYLMYKKQLQSVDGEYLHLASEFENRLDQLALLRNKLFSLSEINVLFNNEETWDRHAIDRLRINQDTSLNRLQKAQLVTQQLKQLPEHMQQAVLPTQALRKVHQIINSTTFNSSNEYNQLSAEFGDEAAQRLIAVNQSQNSWLNKIRLFQQQSSDLEQQFDPSSFDYSRAITKLKQQMFDANDQKRLQVYLVNPHLMKSAG
jgi:lipase chaperone LimK